MQLLMETQNASSEANSDPAESIAESTTTPAALSVEEGETATIAGAIATEATATEATATEPKPSYVKLAMRNMVRKRGLSLQHFTLTTIGLVAFLVGLSYLTR